METSPDIPLADPEPILTDPLVPVSPCPEYIKIFPPVPSLLAPPTKDMLPLIPDETLPDWIIISPEATLLEPDSKEIFPDPALPVAESPDFTLTLPVDKPAFEDAISISPEMPVSLPPLTILTAPPGNSPIVLALP
jgi:hypothetical protein